MKLLTHTEMLFRRKTDMAEWFSVYTLTSTPFAFVVGLQIGLLQSTEGRQMVQGCSAMHRSIWPGHITERHKATDDYYYHYYPGS